MPKEKSFKIKFVGQFFPFFGWSLLGVIGMVCSFGILAPLVAYLQLKYIVENIEVVSN